MKSDEDLGRIFFLDGGKGAEEQAVDVSQDGAAARGDAALGQEIVDGAEGLVDARGGLEVLEIANERGDEAGVVFGLDGGASVVQAKGTGWIRGRQAAATAEGAVLAACGFIGGAGFSGVHFCFLEGYTPPVVFVTATNKGVSGRVGVKADSKGLRRERLQGKELAGREMPDRTVGCDFTGHGSTGKLFRQDNLQVLVLTGWAQEV
jgi:hypothetical protein